MPHHDVLIALRNTDIIVRLESPKKYLQWLQRTNTLHMLMSIDPLSQNCTRCDSLVRKDKRFAENSKFGVTCIYVELQNLCRFTDKQSVMLPTLLSVCCLLEIHCTC